MYQSSSLVSCHYSNVMVKEQFPLMHFKISFGVNVKQSNMDKKNLIHYIFLLGCLKFALFTANYSVISVAACLYTGTTNPPYMPATSCVLTYHYYMQTVGMFQSGFLGPIGGQGKQTANNSIIQRHSGSCSYTSQWIVWYVFSFQIRTSTVICNCWWHESNDTCVILLLISII